MAKIINLHDFKIKSDQKNAFSGWQIRFNQDFDFFSRLSDLSEPALVTLAEPEGNGVEAFRELIMGVLKLGPPTKFLFLEENVRWEIDAMARFLQDQVFYEIMRRLHWVSRYPCERYSLIAVIERFWKEDSRCGDNPVILTESHPGYSRFIKLSEKFRPIFLRNQFKLALESFKNKMKKGDKT